MIDSFRLVPAELPNGPFLHSIHTMSRKSRGYLFAIKLSLCGWFQNKNEHKQLYKSSGAQWRRSPPQISRFKVTGIDVSWHATRALMASSSPLMSLLLTCTDFEWIHKLLCIYHFVDYKILISSKQTRDFLPVYAFSNFFAQISVKRKTAKINIAFPYKHFVYTSCDCQFDRI